MASGSTVATSSGERERGGGEDGGRRAGLGGQGPRLGQDLVAFAEGDRHAVDGSRHLAAAAGTDGEGGGHQAHISRRVV